MAWAFKATSHETKKRKKYASKFLKSSKVLSLVRLKKQQQDLILDLVFLCLFENNRMIVLIASCGSST